MISNVWWDDKAGHFLVRGKPVKNLVGRTSFDWASIVGHQFAGKGGKIPGGALNVAKQWVEHNQEIFGREDVVLVVFGEEGEWSTCPGQPEPSCMFGQEPRDQGAWNIVQLQNLALRNSRVKLEHFTTINLRTIEFAFKVSHETGCIFEWCVDATLKHNTGLDIGSIDHIVRQTASYMRDLQVEYPNAAFMLRPRNEWKAHQGFPVTLKDVNMWATRMYRWKRGTETRVSFTSPGDGWVAEQWPEVLLLVDRGGGNDVVEDIGPEPGKYKLANIHIARKGEPWDWRAPVPQMDQLRIDARGQGVSSNENMYAVTKEDTLEWYRNRNGRNIVYEKRGLEDQMLFYANNFPLFDYIAIHDDIGKKANASWNPNTMFEGALAEFFGGGVIAPPPTQSLRYAGQIQDDWDLILGHPLNDLDVLSERNEMYRRFYEDGDPSGLSKKDHQDVLIRSPEFQNKNPGGSPPIDPPDGPQPNDYITRERAGEKGTGVTDPGSGLLQYLREQDEIWTIRNFGLVVNSSCDTSGDPYNITRAELDDLRREGSQLQWGRESEAEAAGKGIKHPCYISFYGSDDTMETGRLTMVNRRCDDDPPFCGRTDVAKDAFEAWKDAWESWRARAHEVDGRGTGVDGIRHWCSQQETQ